MTEFALAIPVFLVLLFGSLEVGLAFKTRAAYAQAASEAGRVAAAASNDPASDALTLQQLRVLLPAENLNAISSITIYDATLGDNPAALSSTQKSIYTYSKGRFVCQGTTVLPGNVCPSNYWNPSNRQTMTGYSLPLDRIGIRVDYDYYPATHALPPFRFQEYSFTMIEPVNYSTN